MGITHALLDESNKLVMKASLVAEEVGSAVDDEEAEGEEDEDRTVDDEEDSPDEAAPVWDVDDAVDTSIPEDG